MTDFNLAGAAVWPGLEKFNMVQDILEKNKLLVAEINSNHSVKSPDGLSRNVHLIRELDSNIAKVVVLYKEMSSSLEQIALQTQVRQPTEV